MNNKWIFFRTPGIIDDAISGMAFDTSSTLWIGNDICVNQQHENLTFHRIAGLEVFKNVHKILSTLIMYQGLPYSNITSVAAGFDGSVWIGSLNGTFRYFEVRN